MTKTEALDLLAKLLDKSTPDEERLICHSRLAEMIALLLVD